MTRQAKTLNVSIARVTTTVIEIDCGLPLIPGDAKAVCYLPVTYLPKDPVSPDLQVRDALGGVIAVPTKRANMALTQRALKRLVDSGHFDLDGVGVELLHDVVHADFSLAHASRLIQLGREEKPNLRLHRLLRALEDQFVLWIPVFGAPGSEHHISITRGEHRQAEPIVVPARMRKRRLVTIKTAVGVIKVRVRPVSPTRLKPQPAAALRRLLNAFAVRPVEFRASESEAARFFSYHQRIHAPSGFLVRNIRAASLADEDPEDTGRSRELADGVPGVVIQGQNSDVAHLHLSDHENPSRLYTRVTLGLRSGMTTLWMLAAALTAALLWLVHHHASYGDPELQNKQIVAAVLLVGPAFASAYSLRADNNELLRTVLSGARGLLLVSAALSVATALALAAVFPASTSRHDAIEIYASASYFVAIPLVSAWILSGRLTWLVFRHLLFNPERNLIVVGFGGLLALAVGSIVGLPVRISGLLLLASGLSAAAVAANPVADPLLRSGAGYRIVAGVSAIPSFVIAGYFLGFFEGVSTHHAARISCQVAGLVVALVAFAGIIWHASPGSQESTTKG